MSLERACVNCERCFTLASSEIKNFPENYNIRICQDDQIYLSRNEAMKALERIIESVSYEDAIDMSNRGVKNPSVIAGRALKACRACDYSAPKIVVTIENLSQSSKPAKE